MANVGNTLHVKLAWNHQYRIISSKLPPINFFEGKVDPELSDAVFAIESMTNPRLLEEVGNLSLVLPEDRIFGPGASPVMAAFTHPSIGRFTDGSYGAYYAAKTLKTAHAETKHSRAGFMRCTNEDPGVLTMRTYIGEVRKSMIDARSCEHEKLRDPNDWVPGQVFGRQMRDQREWGIVYRSARDPDGECIAALRPPAVSIPRQGPHFGYHWDGHEIREVFALTAS